MMICGMLFITKAYYQGILRYSNAFAKDTNIPETMKYPVLLLFYWIVD